MVQGSVSQILRFVRGLQRQAPESQATETELLAQFVAGDQASFARIVQRLGPLVYGVCRRVLHDEHEAEDAFQATFLVLARKASTLRQPERLAGWLCGVAFRVACKLRGRGARQRRIEIHGMQVSSDGISSRVEVGPEEAICRAEVQQLLEEEVQRLPCRYRIPVVLHHLQGKTQQEVARLLGCPRKTVTTRLARAREQIRQRLVRRGVTLSGVGLATWFSVPLAPAAVPSALQQATLEHVARWVVGGVLPARVLALTKGALQTMLWHKVKVFALVLFGLGVLVACTSWLVSRVGSPAEQPVLGRAVGEELARAADPAVSGVSVASMPPVVVQTIPRSGEQNVDADKVKEIRVTFSKKMLDGNWSWVRMSKETFPTTTGKVRYEKDGRTCVLPVALKPGKTYVIWMNSQRFTNFKDIGRRAAVPYLLVFETKP